MMRRRKNPQNFWFLLALPFVGVVGWVISRFIGQRNTDAHQAIPISGRHQAMEQPEDEAIRLAKGPPHVKEQRAVRDLPAAKEFPRETGLKSPSVETKSTLTANPRDAVPNGKEAAPVHEQSADRAGHALRNRPERLSSFLVLLTPFLILPVAVVILAFYHLPEQSQPIVPGGDPNQGKTALQVWGCGSCHSIKGIPGANGTVGPALNNESDRSYIGGHLRNTPDNMVQWIAHPQQVSPGVDMPDSGVPESVARDMAAYLYSIH